MQTIKALAAVVVASIGMLLAFGWIMQAFDTGPQYTRAEIAGAIQASDDYAELADPLIDGTRQVLALRYCNLHELRTGGGWIRSVRYKPAPVFFTYCDGARVYLDLVSGKISRS